jgi:hypothetical protein
MKITDASKELYQKLRTYDEVVGTGVVAKSDAPYIVVYLEKASKAILDKIPSFYKGNSVKTEVTSPFFGF